MDGRVQLPVIQYLQKRFNTKYVDSVTEPGPILILSEQQDKVLFDSILSRVSISIEKHDSRYMAIVAHHDCAGNPLPKEEQLLQLEKSLKIMKKYYKDIKIIGLWVNDNWEVKEVF
jgi:hypothetical protein